jgi:hypothetical protein
MGGLYLARKNPIGRLILSEKEEIELINLSKERFMKHVVDTGYCWEWIASKKGAGYGQFGIQKNRKQKIYSAHKVAYLLFKGKVAKNLEVRHLCHNASCINPEHLELGTHQDNHDDNLTNPRYYWGLGYEQRRKLDKERTLGKSDLTILREAKIMTKKDKVNREGVATISMDRETLRNLFLSKIEKEDKENGCWIWIGPKTTWGGYLTLGKDGDKLAHRISYELFIGDLRKGSVYKTCQNMMCVNPAHLYQKEIKPKVSKRSKKDE